MAADNRFFEDFSRVASGAMGAMSGLRSEIETMMRSGLDRLANDLNLAQREEIDGIRDLAAAARDAQETMTIRLTAMEERLGLLEAQIAALASTVASAASKPAPATPRAKAPKAAKPESK